MGNKWKGGVGNSLLSLKTYQNRIAQQHITLKKKRFCTLLLFSFSLNNFYGAFDAIVVCVTAKSFFNAKKGSFNQMESTESLCAFFSSVFLHVIKK